jgi:1,4-dihydroxy-2-naphthoate polyprenyltransferase
MLKDLFLIIKMGRFLFLFGGFLIFCLGFLVSSNNNIDYFRFGLILFPVLIAQLSVSFSNDYFDYKFDSKNKRTLISGGSGVLQNNPNLRDLAKTISLFLIFLSIALSFAFVFLFNLPIVFLLMVISACIFGWFYSSPPFRFSSNNFGEFTTFLVVGLLLPFAGSLVASNFISFNVILLIPAMFLYSLFFSLSVQIPDYASDLKNKKNNFTTTKGVYLSSKFIVIVSLVSMSYLFLVSRFFIVFQPIFLFSFIPILFSFLLFYFVRKKKNLVLACILNINALFLFIFLSDLMLFFGV